MIGGEEKLWRNPNLMKTLIGKNHAGLWIFGLLLWLMVAGGASAAEAQDGPQGVIRMTASQLQTSLQQPAYRDDFAKATALVDRIINPHVDFDRVAILVLGKNWKAATPEQQAKFKKEFRMLLVRTYTTAFTEYSDWHINYLPLDGDASDKKAMVKTEIIQSGGKPVAVNYRMINDGSEWKVYDVLIEGVSLLQNYRTSFGDELERGESMDQLIANLSERNAVALADAANPKSSAP
mgnify:CR=1 FL=1